MPTAPPPDASVRPPRFEVDPNAPTGVEMLDELLVYMTMPVIGLTVCPGFLLCVPALAFAIVPLIVLGVLAVAAGVAVAVVAAPVLGARAVARRIASMHVASEGSSIDEPVAG